MRREKSVEIIHAHSLGPELGIRIKTCRLNLPHPGSPETTVISRLACLMALPDAQCDPITVSFSLQPIIAPIYSAEHSRKLRTM